MADEQQAPSVAEQQNPQQGGTAFPPEFFDSVNAHLELCNKQSQQHGERNISLAALFAAARFNAHVFLMHVKPIAAAEERAPFLDHMTTMYRRMLNEHLDGMGEERGIDVGDSELAAEYAASGVQIGRLKGAKPAATPAGDYVAAAAAVPPAANE